MEYTHIKMRKDGVSFGNRRLAKDELIPVGELSPDTVADLVATKRAEPVVAPVTAKTKSEG